MPIIKPEIENKVFSLVADELKQISCPVRIINGMPDHIHCLFLQSPQKSMMDIIKQVKGGSTHEINLANISTEKFTWQTGYAAYSVSESALDKVFQYIKNQKQHHQNRTFEEEYDEFLRLHQISENG